ncbi:MAG: aldehyde ferredoxin oxidoreductase N-terminal domain-containing protein, partial [Nitrososphaerota archaeon]
MEFKGGYVGQVLEVDLKERKVRKLRLRQDLASTYIGGRGFTSRLLYEELTPEIDPLSPENPLIFASGPLTGTSAPS